MYVLYSSTRIPYSPIATWVVGGAINFRAGAGRGAVAVAWHRTRTHPLETGSSTFKLTSCQWKPGEALNDGDCLSSEDFGGFARYWSCLLHWLEAFRITCEYLHFSFEARGVSEASQTPT